ncbi:hypothetical protein [Actinomyces ruminicola]|uniref:hypothetical protein n=1 Tax=Actinomyces ruminicola TaxID=332524 RepID=UPI0011C8A0C4|nr:hypothetical protein [Actinomyces ruminicola]
MSEPARGPSPEPGPADVPQWINDLVPIAAHARALLRASAPTLALAVAAVLALPQLTPFSAPWVAAVCMVLGNVVALRHGGRNASTDDATDVGGNTTGSRATADARAEVGARTQSTSGTAAVIAAGELRPGGRTGALLVVLDLLLTATGVAALVGLALAGTDRPLLVAAAGAAAGLAAGVGTVAGLELSGRRARGAFVVLGAVAVAVIAAVVYVFNRLGPAWWWVLALAVVADAVGLLALRAGARNDRAPTRPGVP